MKASLRLYQATFIISALVFCRTGIAAGPPLPEQLQQLVSQDPVKSGYFLQCTEQGRASIVNAGDFLLEQGRSIKLNFHEPKPYTITFFKDGTHTRTLPGAKEGKKRHSLLSSLLVSVISFQQAQLEKRFKVNYSGTIQAFYIDLIPKKRVARIIQSLKISGLAGSVSKIQMVAPGGRAITLRFFSEDPPAQNTCE